MKPSDRFAASARSSCTPPANQWRCTLAGEKHCLTVSGGREPVALPPDRYRVRSYRLSLKSDGAARGPTIGGGGSTQSVDVPAGKTTPLGIGSPIRARVTVTKSPAGVRLSLSQTDAAGAEISSVLGTGGKRPAKPEIDVVDGKGKVVYTATLEYG